MDEPAGPAAGAATDPRPRTPPGAAADAGGKVEGGPARVRAWDLPVRLVHWTLAVLVVCSLVSGKVGGGWMVWHVRSGYAILALVLFRIAWGLAGSTTARFADFLRGPAAVWRYARSLIGRERDFHVGHNPLGGWMVVVLLVALLAQAATGLFADDEISIAGPLAEVASSAVVRKATGLHKRNANVLIGLAVLHVAAVAFYAAVKREDLVRPMLHGWKRPPRRASHDGTRGGSLGVAALLLALAAGVVWLVVVQVPGWLRG